MGQTKTKELFFLFVCFLDDGQSIELHYKMCVSSFYKDTTAGVSEKKDGKEHKLLGASIMMDRTPPSLTVCVCGQRTGETHRADVMRTNTMPTFSLPQKQN